MGKKKSKTRSIGILTSGGDCPGLNSAIRAITKTAMYEYGMRVIGFLDGFRGLVENRFVLLDDEHVSGILTQGGTILGTSRDKPHRMTMGDKVMDMTSAAVENARKLQIDCLVCLGGGGTQKNAWRLYKKSGLPVMTLPKTIDNDVVETDVSFGYDTAMSIATEAIDRLHTTATSHHRIIVCEVMGHRTGWLTLGAGLAGGADVVLIPEIPYDLEVVKEYLLERRRAEKRFSIIAVAEGARSLAEVEAAKKTLERETGKQAARAAKKGKAGKKGKETAEAALAEELWNDETREGLPLIVRRVEDEVMAYHVVQEPMSSRIARQLQDLTGMEARVTTLGHVQRGGIPTPFDRMLCTLMGTKAAELLARGVYNVMIGYRGEECEPVPLEKVAGLRKFVPPDHPLVESARLVGTCLGDR
jgi:6-phosphofructokinase 1